MTDSVSAHRVVRTIRLDDKRAGEILDGLDGSEARFADKGQSQRYHYRMKAIVVHMRQPGAGSAIPYLTPTRDLSEGGLAFLYDGFVHPRGHRPPGEVVLAGAPLGQDR